MHKSDFPRSKHCSKEIRLTSSWTSVTVVTLGATVIGSDFRTNDLSRLIFSISSGHFSVSDADPSDEPSDLVDDLPRPESEAEPRPESHSLKII